MCQAVAALMREGARRVLASGVHGVLSGPAIARLRDSPVEEIIISNSIPLSKDHKLDKITVLSTAKVLAHTPPLFSTIRFSS
jgi:ribose-phosphate pyrophosphokinase